VAPIRVRLIAAAALLSGGGILIGADTVAFTEVLRRAHAYVVTYEDHELSTVVAREHYYQQWVDADARSKGERTLLSDYLLFQLPPDEDWFALRDVHEVDGVPVSDRSARLEALFAGPRELQSDRVMEILKESARFNLAPELYYRTVNVATFPLRFLRPASRKRFEYKNTGEEQIEATRTLVVGYRETKGPTFTGTPEGKDLPAQGRFWVEPETGAIVRSEMILGGTRRVPARLTITVTYGLAPALGFRVPVEMLERYDNPRRTRDDVVVARATYSDFRRFDWRALVRPGSVPGAAEQPPNQPR
jgi:hypothetical protein